MTTPLTGIKKEDKERYNKLFKNLDKNKDGKIEVSELAAYLKTSKNAQDAKGQAKVETFYVNL